MGRLLEEFRAQDADGVALVGALLYTYQTATTTPKTTYSDDALSVSNANPIVADAAGRFGAVYGSEDVRYKLVLKTSAGVEIWTKDVYSPAALVVASTATRVKQIASSPLDYNSALGDGVANEVAAVQAAIDAATRTVDGCGKTFRCDSQITLRSGIRLINMTLDFTAATDTEYIKIHGSKGTATNLTANVTYGSKAVAVTSASGLATGDIVSVDSTETYIDDGVCGELMEIDSIAGLNLTMSGPALDKYETADTVKLAKITTVDDVVLENVRIIANNAIATATPRVISALNCRRLRIRDCRLDGIKTFGIIVMGCWDTVIERCTFSDDVGAGEAICWGGATQWLTIRDCSVVRMDSGFAETTALSLTTVGLGPRRMLTIENNRFDGCDVPIMIRQDAEHVRIVGNRIVGGDDASAQIDVRCPNVVIAKNEMEGGTGLGISLQCKTPLSTNRSGRLYSITVAENHLYGTSQSIDYDGVTGGVNASAIASLSIIANRLDGSSGNLSIDSGATVPPALNRVSVIGNEIVGTLTVEAVDSILSQAVIGGNIIGGAVVISGGAAALTSAVLNSNYFGGAVTIGGAGGAVTNLAAHGNVVNSASGIALSTAPTRLNESGTLRIDSSLPKLQGPFSSVVNITKTEIVGNSAGDLGHASGVTLVAAPGAGKAVIPIAVVIDFTFATAQYTGGGDVSAKYDGSEACTGVTTAAESFLAAASNIQILRPLSGAVLSNVALVLVAASAFTDPGTAAGTAALRTYYYIMDI